MKIGDKIVSRNPFVNGATVLEKTIVARHTNGIAFPDKGFVVGGKPDCPGYIDQHGPVTVGANGELASRWEGEVNPDFARWVGLTGWTD